MNDNQVENPRATPGSNTNPETYGQQVTERLEKDYAGLRMSVSDLLAEARRLPAAIDNEDQLGEYATVIKKARDLKTRIEKVHGDEKLPFLRGGQACDTFFFADVERLTKRNKTGKAGALDVLLQRVTNYQTIKEEQERARLRAEAVERQRIADEAAAKARREAAEAEEARLAAERARKPETTAAKGAVADIKEAAATEAKVEATVAATEARDAQLATHASAADLTRTRVAGGHTVTTKQVPFVEIVDRDALDKAAIWPFIKEEHLLAAVKAWAKVGDHKKPMAGATIEMRSEGMVL